jgi:hypothetical protein
MSGNMVLVQKKVDVTGEWKILYNEDLHNM